LPGGVRASSIFILWLQRFGFLLQVASIWVGGTGSSAHKTKATSHD